MTDAIVNTPVTAVPTIRSWEVQAARWRTIALYLAPALVVMTIITFYPLIYQVWMSTTEFGVQNLRQGAVAPEPIGLDNYLKIVDGRLHAKLPNFNFARMLGFNLWWTFSNVIIHVSLGILIALLVNTKGLWFKGIYRAIYVVPII